jgi:hypothetical protein
MYVALSRDNCVPRLPEAILRCTYGPGRGEMIDGQLYVGPSGLHCSSAVNVILAWLCGSDDFDPLGNIPAPVNKILEQELIDWKGLNRKVRGHSDDAQFKMIRNNKVQYHNSLIKLIDLAPDGAEVIVWEQSSLRSNGKWKWGHHVGLLLKSEHGWMRAASDGYATGTKNKVYSRTPFSYKNVPGEKEGLLFRGWTMTLPLKPRPQATVLWKE